MSYLTSELSNLLLGFTKDSCKTNKNKLVISKDYSLFYNETNRDIAVDSVRYSIINNGIYQTYAIINDLPDDSKKSFKLAAYDGILKMVNFVLLPSPFPLKYYEKCCISSTILTEVVDEMSVNLQLLNELFKPILKYDKFVKDLLSISNEVYGPGGRKITEDLRTHISRSDYFIHIENLDRESSEREFCRYCQYDHCLCHFGRTATSGQEKPDFKLVEINLGGCSLSHYSKTVHKVHDKVLTTSIIDLHESDKEKTEKLVSEKKTLHMNNDPDMSFTLPISESHKAYLNRYTPIFGQKRVCVFLIPDINFINYIDTYFISSDVFDKYGIFVKTVQLDLLIDWMKRKMLFLASDWEYNPDGTVKFTDYSCYGSKLKPGRLVLNLMAHPNFTSVNKSNLFEVSTVYSRDYYDSSEMVSDDSVNLRKLIEFSDAVKIPNSLLQLVNTKRAQMYFSSPENVDELLSSYNKRVKGVMRNKGLSDLVKGTSILQVDPSLESSVEVVNDAIKNPHKYVLKANREIGKGLYFDEMLASRLKECLNNKEELSQYVLMKKISVPSQPGLFVKHLKNGSFEVFGYHSLTELGIYHYALYDGNECKVNEANGYLARTKPEFATGGGLSAGCGFINSVLLF
ncbi:glutathione synthetase [Theileria orientalis]|uniref:Glutathione synthetase n=1 Tax=Theileria orientalis TaxID=68886 RepID=A0A976QPN9_THEOR|nr:glutathione synthetase [Theileria orientalis]